ncbi:MAG TPA: choice-of-anchor tandem repeat GloVer-containing protein [Thermoanaerobaculia bacterium]|nr:choice-of-anchor tandem repeat GloVer-containing protein [Thermoanaerobaculia bacterium]
MATSNRRGALASAFLLLGLCAGIGPAGGQVLTVLHSFSGTGDDGSTPEAGLVEGSDGNFYGTTSGGGSNGVGTIFQITPGGTLMTIHSFNGNDGATPRAALVDGSDGAFYGTVGYGFLDYGSFFRVTPTGAFATLFHFYGSEGGQPNGIVLASDGYFYGTTNHGIGPVYVYGTVFRVTSGGGLSTLYTLDGSTGRYPNAPPIEGTDGLFYGTIEAYGTYGQGTIYGMTSSGSLTVLHSFGASPGEGAAPFGKLLAASDGNLYGTTRSGGAGAGTLFRMARDGTSFATLRSFVDADGCVPNAGLIQVGGNLYGTTSACGVDGNGTLFQITPAGNFVVFHYFHGTDGSSPRAPLLLGSDGYLYGTTSSGGGSGFGTVFKVALPSKANLDFYTLTPCRVLDTRNAAAPLGGPALAAGADRIFPLAGTCGIPADARSVSLNVTITQPTAAGDLRLFPGGAALPLVSTINYRLGETRANNAIATLGPSGGLDVWCDQTSGTVHLIIDVNGYFQ